MFRRAVGHLGQMAFSGVVVSVAVWFGSRPSSQLAGAAAAAVVAVLVVIWSAWGRTDRALPASDHVQGVSGELSEQFNCARLPVWVSTEERGLASLCGFGARRRIQVSPQLLERGEVSLRAVLAHEYAHKVLHHQWWSVAGLTAVWSVPVVVVTLLVRETGLAVWVGALTGATLVVAGLAAWRAAMRGQELMADALVARLPVLGELLNRHLQNLVSLEDGESRSSGLHPSSRHRLGRLQGSL